MTTDRILLATLSALAVIGGWAAAAAGSHFV